MAITEMTKLAILGILVRDGPQSVQSISRTLSGMTNRKWSYMPRSIGQIMPSLMADGLVSREKSNGVSAVYIYTATPRLKPVAPKTSEQEVAE